MYHQKSKVILTSCILLGMVLSAGQAQITGSGTTNYIPKFTGSTSIGNSAIYQSSGGLVGIGTSSPQNKLHVNAGTANDVALFESTDPGAVILLKDSTTTTQWGHALARIGDTLELRTMDTPRLMITGPGNVGIGTTTPSRKLTVRGDILVERTEQDVSIAMKDNTTAAADPVALRRRGDNLSLFTNGAERLTVASDGNVTIGTTTNPLGWKLLVNGATGVAGSLMVDGSSYLTMPSYQSGTAYHVYVDGDKKLWRGAQVGSSLRYKTRVRDLDANTSAILDLRPVRFEWKSSGEADIGLIAEEVEKVLPDLVVSDDQGRPNTVKYDKVPMYLLTVIRTQQSQITALEERLKALEEAVKHIETEARWPVTDIPSGPRE